MLGQRSVPTASPRLESRDELDLIDEAVLQSQHAEEQIVGGGHGELSWKSARGGKCSVRDVVVLQPAREAMEWDYRITDNSQTPHHAR